MMTVKLKSEIGGLLTMLLKDKTIRGVWGVLTKTNQFILIFSISLKPGLNQRGLLVT